MIIDRQNTHPDVNPPISLVILQGIKMNRLTGNPLHGIITLPLIGCPPQPVSGIFIHTRSARKPAFLLALDVCTFSLGDAILL